MLLSASNLNIKSAFFKPTALWNIGILRKSKMLAQFFAMNLKVIHRDHRFHLQTLIARGVPIDSEFIP